jgi:hypothetical protein
VFFGYFSFPFSAFRFQFMNKNYNYLRRRLMIPEYGRHIQEMVDSLLEIEDRDERTRQAKAVIAVMGNLNPLLRDTADFTHKLWDHLFIMSDFRLDVDSPYPLPTREDLMVKPERLAYPQGFISHKHYGKNIAKIIKSIGAERISTAGDTLRNAILYMRNKSAEYNQDYPNNEEILNDLMILSEGAIILDEEWLKKNDTECKVAHSNQKNKRQQRPSKQQSKQQKGGRKGGQRHNMQ